MPVTVDKQWPKQPDREYNTSVSLDVLRNYYNKHTSAEGDRLAGPHIGTWIRINGAVKDARILITEHGQKSGCVILQDKESYIRTSLLFAEGWNDRIDRLQPGEHIFVEGRIASVEHHAVTVKDCELLT